MDYNEKVAPMPKLDTAEAVLEWAGAPGTHNVTDWNEPNANVHAAAAYLAECVRLRQAFDDFADDPQHGEHALVFALRDAIKGDGDGAT